MRKPKQHHANIFDIAQQERSSSPRRLLAPKASSPLGNAQQPIKSASIFDATWPQEVERMFRELDQLKSKLRTLEKESGISLSGSLQIPDHFTEAEKLSCEAHVEKRQEDLKQLIVLPQFLRQQKAKEARLEKRERMIRTVGKRKRWLSL